MKNLKNVLKDFYLVSKNSNIKRKKLRLIYSAIAGNLVAILDILIILLFTKFLTNTLNYTNFLLEILIANKFSIVLIVVLRFLLNFFGKYNIISLQYDVEEDLREQLLNEMYDKGNYSLSDATYFINTLSIHVSTFYGAATMFLTYVLQFTIYFVFLVDSNFELMLFMFVGVLTLFFPIKYVLKMGRVLMDKSFHLNIQTGRDIQRVIDNTYLIKILKTKNLEFKNFLKIIQKNYDVAKKAFIYKEISTTLPHFVAVTIFSFVIILNRFSSILSIEFIGIILRFVQTFGTINNSLAMLINSHVHVEKYLGLESNLSKNKDWISEVDFASDKILSINNLNFKYFGSDEYIFENLNLDLFKGKHYIILGENGSGKSTLIGLLAGVLIPEKGNITRQKLTLGYIGANPLIVRGSLRENLLYGSKNKIDDNKLQNYLTELKVFKESNFRNLSDEITSSTLSSGQMQKISFIRALVADVDLIFLDESTANLDDESKIIISRLLENMNITIINSTHSKDEFKYDEIIEIKVKDDKRAVNIIK